MKEEIKKVRKEAISKQKQSVVEEVAVLEIHKEYMLKDLEAKLKDAKAIKKKAERENAVSSLEQYKIQKIDPMSDNIKFKSAYYEHLCSLEE